MQPATDGADPVLRQEEHRIVWQRNKRIPPVRTPYEGLLCIPNSRKSGDEGSHPLRPDMLSSMSKQKAGFVPGFA
jgi:hypothetical protein